MKNEQEDNKSKEGQSYSEPSASQSPGQATGQSGTDKPAPGSPEAKRKEEEKALADKKAKALGENTKDGYESSGDPESAQNALI